jgi:hypothetical protein
MRCYGIILLILLAATCCSAQQNLILNGRFEETVSPDSCYTGPICKDVFVGLNSRHFIRDWWNPTNVSPDYFNRCDTSNCRMHFLVEASTGSTSPMQGGTSSESGNTPPQQ